MKRSKRMQTVERVVSDVERKRAEALAACERRVAESERKLAELESYQKTYAMQFNARAGSGIGAAGLRDFQTFMARLAEAVKQQAQIVSKARADRDAELKTWQHAAQRAEAVGGLVKRWQSEERRAEDKREQSESDERSQRPSPYALRTRHN
ncbi:MAG TPA: flagellar export protein FliJ [Steroidobacteraceae bacterium]|nr:flagellar export protein FliJ [Steroidobacteraceae bacterium]